MSISFIRVDDRMVHGQTCTRWALEYPCDGIVAVNDKAATTPVLKAAYKNAAIGKKTFVWTYEEWKTKCQKVLDSSSRYFLITKEPTVMAKILVDDKFQPGIKEVIIGPCNDRPGTVKLGNNQSITQAEADALERIYKAGYKVVFALIKEAAIGPWEKFRGQFGYKD